MDDRVVTCGYCGEKKGNARPFKESLLSKIEQEKEEEEEEEEDRWWIEGNDDRIYSPRFDEIFHPDGHVRLFGRARTVPLIDPPAIVRVRKYEEGRGGWWPVFTKIGATIGAAWTFPSWNGGGLIS